ncbi:hypothetical protein NP493_11g09029 [Ridgeia piscesae]|uniref:protein-tyrosine-phosphatase n=1 Tax=Ridgeia piscesae TaxID=27915 RepID=A0AAD9PF18_RIDPI|nr:hypothetical protein NP493_11g09029 [Ridgeia piscesae]
MLNLFIAADQVNVAAKSNGATCTASRSDSNRPCDGAIDEQEYSSSSRWAFTGDAVGTWFTITFAKAYSISAVQIMPLSTENNIERISLTFDDDTNITLTPEADDWANFTISPPVISKTINLTVLSVYYTSKKYNGLTEIRVHGTDPVPVTISQATTAGIATTHARTAGISEPRAPTTGISKTHPSTTGISETHTTTKAISKTTIPPKKSQNVPMYYIYIAIAAAVFIVFVVLLAVIVVLVRRYGLFVCHLATHLTHLTHPSSHPPSHPTSHPATQPPTHPSTHTVPADPGQDGDPEYANVAVEKPIRVSELTDYFQRLYSTPNGFRKEFLDIPEHPAKTERSRKVERIKNRYNNIMPYDHSRVMLSPVDGDPDSDYINANYIHGYKKQNRFIATQGPNEETTADFWRMVWEQNSTRILMLTNVKERGKTKCSQYWPDEGTKTYGAIQVEYLQQETWPDFIVRTFRLKKNTEERFVKQYHFTTWPDEGAPENGSGLLHFHEKVDGYNDSEDAPIIVHCSAGVGRTGTYIVLDMSLKRAAAEDVVDVSWCVHQMRLNRINMVQTLEQYVFIYSTLVEALLFGGVSIPCATYKPKLEQLASDDDGQGTRMARMYKVLEIFKPPTEAVSCDDATTSENQPKNRSSAILPSEKNRPYLKSRGDELTSDYINAVFVNGYRKTHAFIATQMPLPNTQVDFWRMVDDFDVVAIVMINPLISGDEMWSPYWPEDEDTKELGPFLLKKVNTTTTDAIKMTDIELTTVNSDKKPSMVRHFRLLDWPEDATVPANSSTVLQMFAEIQRWKRQHNDGIVVTHCSHGVRRCGFLCALSNTLDKIDVEQEVDVFNSVKCVRQCRPAFISNLEQFEALYRFAGDYMDGHSVYANFQ